MMQGIVFKYEEKRSIKNRLFTVRIEERQKKGNKWVPIGPRGFYTARDLQNPNLKIIDKELFSMAFKSEIDFRKQEARFHSMEEEYTLFRISPYDLKSFLARCRNSCVLCANDGTPVHFRYITNTIPRVFFKETGTGFVPIVFLKETQMSHTGFEMISSPVRILSGNAVYELAQNLPVTIVKQLTSGREIAHDAWKKLVDDLSMYPEAIDFTLPGKKKKKVRNSSVTPVLDFDESLRFARLEYVYDEFGRFTLADKQAVVFNPEKNIELHRNFSEETAIRGRLENQGVKYQHTTRGEWVVPKKNSEEILLGIKRSGFRISLAGRPLELDIRVTWDIKARDNKLIVGGAVQYKTDTTDMENILDAYLSGQRWFDLPGGRRGYIQKTLLQAFNRLDQRGDFRDNDILFDTWDFPLIDQVFQGKTNVIRDDTFESYLSFLAGIAQPGYQTRIPKSLNATLRPYQKTGFSWLAALHKFGFGGILADDMGLGKTIQVLALLLYLKDNRNCAGPSLLAVPKTLIWNWVSEIDRFAPSLDIKIHTGPGRDKTFDNLSNIDLVITSYGLVRMDIDIFSPVTWDLVILDEAQAVKNPAAKISRSIRRLHSSNRIALTGTPIENRPLDLWSLFDFLMPGFLGDKVSFQEIYEQQDREALDTLGILTSPFILRRMKKQVCSELPVKTEVTMLCDFNESQKAVYDDILTTGKHQVSRQVEEAQSMQALTVLLRLRQAACHPSLVPGEEAYHGSSGKFEMVWETAQEILGNGYKILVFSQFVAHLELVRHMFEQHGVEHHVLYGSTRQRHKVVDRFQQSPNPCVFFISLKTGGVGLNLTEAGYVFLLDPWWNPAIENQAIDRSHRIGQENPVTVYRFITRNSVEENVNQLKEKKKLLEKAILNQSEFENIPFSKNELLELILR